MTLASGECQIFPLVYLSAFASIWPAVQSLRLGLPQIQGCQCGAYVGAVEEIMGVCVLQRGHSVMDVIWRRLCVNMI